MSTRGEEWSQFADEVLQHIEVYTVTQYGDKGEDQVTEYTVEDCLTQVKKYLARYGKNQRPGQEHLDFFKAAQYIQMAYNIFKDQR